ncbi:MAG TPA: DUF2085 domain-containing protein [Desulfuromonadaceae bacterium]
MHLTDMCRHICHQLPQRSFLWLWDPPLLCARCTGFYLGVAAGLALLFVRRKPTGVGFGALIAALVPSALEIGVEQWWKIDPGNWVRALTALLLGAAVGVGIGAPLKTFYARRTIRKSQGGEQ